MRYSCGHVSTKKNVRGIKDAATSTPPQLRSSRYIRYRDNIGYPRYGERYDIGDNQYSSNNLSYCPINRFLESITNLRKRMTLTKQTCSPAEQTLRSYRTRRRSRQFTARRQRERRKPREEERTSCESCPQSCACRRALVQGRRERVQIFKHERAPITRPSTRHSFTLVSHARPHTFAGH